MNNNLEFENEDPSPDSIEDDHPRTNYGQGYYEEPKQYPIGGYAPGFYSCKCVNCKIEFTGDKRAVQCEPCAIKTTKEEPKQLICEHIKEYGCIKDICTCNTGPKQETTLEEVAENYADKQSDISMRQNPLEYSTSGEELWYESKVDFIEGSKWMEQRMYSEDKVIILLNKFGGKVYGDYTRNQTMEDFTEEWFEQFKKK
jgi:hypothetical protein